MKTEWELIWNTPVYRLHEPNEKGVIGFIQLLSRWAQCKGFNKTQLFNCKPFSGITQKLMYNNVYVFFF